MDITLLEGPDGRARCGWCEPQDEYRRYHDEEWGRPVGDDRRLFEKLSLEAFQAGLSWWTILRKRPAFREAFAGFQPSVLAEYGEAEVLSLLGNAGIVRHRGKIEAVLGNARAFTEHFARPGSFAAFVWSFEAEKEVPPTPIRSQSPESVAFSKALKKLGFRFVGPTTAYALFQAMGLVNDHFPGCSLREACAEECAAFVRPR